MYTFFAVLITAALVVLTVLGARCRTIRDMKKYMFINLGIAAVSLIVGTVIPIVTRSVIFGGDFTEEWQSWAWDAFAVFLKTTLPLLGICLALICLTTLVTSAVGRRHNLFSKVIRQTASVALSVVLLFLAPFYSAMAETDQAALHVFILILGICEALFMRLSFVLELGIRIRLTKQTKTK